MFCWVHTVWCVWLCVLLGTYSVVRAVDIRPLCVCTAVCLWCVTIRAWVSCRSRHICVYNRHWYASTYVCAHMHDCSYRPMQCMSSARHWSGPTAAVLRFWITVLTDALPLLHAPDQVHCAVLYGMWLCVKCSSRLSG